MYLKSWANLNIGLRLSIGIAIILLITLLVGLVGWFALESQTRSQELAKKAVGLVSSLHIIRQSEKNYILDTKNQNITKTLQNIINLQTQARTLKDLLPDNQQKKINKLLLESNIYKKHFEDFVFLNKNNTKSLQEMLIQARALEKSAIILREHQKNELYDLEASVFTYSKEREKKSKNLYVATSIVELLGEARQEEKNFLLRGETYYIQSTKDFINKLILQAQALKNSFRDTQNKLLAQEIIDAAKEYISEFDRVSKGETEKTRANSKLIQLAKELEKYLQKVKNETILKLLSEAREKEKKFLIHNTNDNEDKRLSLINLIIKESTRIYNELSKDNSKQLALNIIKVAKEYQSEFNIVQRVTGESLQAQDIMTLLGQRVKNRATLLSDDQKMELQKLEQLSNNLSQQRLIKRIKADDANRIIKLMAEARQEEKNFLLRGEYIYVQKTHSLIAKILKQAELLKKDFKKKLNKELVSKIVLATQKYLKEFEDVVLVVKQQKKQQLEMLDAAHNIELFANNIQEQTQLQANQNKHLAISIILVSIIMGLIIGTFIAYILSKTIVHPIQELIGVINSLAKEDNVEVPFLNKKDEIGEISRSISNFKEILLQRKKLVDAQLLEADKMVALGDLVAGVSHEINTPVGIAITASTHLRDQITMLENTFLAGSLRKADFKTFVENAIPTIDSIENNLNRAAELVKSFKQVAVDQSSQESREFLLLEYMQEILKSLQPKLKEFTHNVTISGDENLMVKTIPGAISQVVTNLIINSLVHAYDEEMQNGEIEINIVDEGDMALINYSDDGKGIDAITLQRIYEPFFTTKRGRGGSGLGLSIIYNLVTQTLKGKIMCKSDIGKGTLFSIYIPKNYSIGSNK